MTQAFPAETPLQMATVLHRRVAAAILVAMQHPA
jgi:hypothetical protein